MAAIDDKLAIIEKPDSVAKFVTLFQGTRKVSAEQAAQTYEVEKFDFKRQLFEKGLGDDCSQVSIAGTFLDVVRNGLSFGSAKNHVFLMSRSVKNNTTGQFEKRLYYSLTPDGLIYITEKAKSVNAVSNPVIVYDGDDFQPYLDENGNQKVIHKPLIPRKPGARIIAGYVIVTLPSNQKEAFYMLEEDWKRLEGYSKKQNTRKGQEDQAKPNALYTSGLFGQIDPGFLKAKLIKFALKNKRKAELRGDSFVEAEDEDFISPHTEVLPEGLPPAVEKKTETVPTPAQPSIPSVSEEEYAEYTDDATPEPAAFHAEMEEENKQQTTLGKIDPDEPF